MSKGLTALNFENGIIESLRCWMSISLRFNVNGVANVGKKDIRMKKGAASNVTGLPI